MIGAISLIRRRDDIDVDRFRRHWLDIHGPLVCRLPGLRCYAQSHVAAALTPTAQAMRIDGFAELAFDRVAACAAAYGSAELAACDRDSPGFIGAVSRLVTDFSVILPPPDTPDVAKRVILFPPGAPADCSALTRSRPRGLIWHVVLEQARAPNSAVPEMLCPVAALAEMWFGAPAIGAGTDPGTDPGADPGADVEAGTGAGIAPPIGAAFAGVFSVIEHRLR